MDRKSNNALTLVVCVGLFSGTTVHLWSEDGLEAEVVGLDYNGFLQVYNQQQGVLSLEPDGNSFDMLKNLVVIKQH